MESTLTDREAPPKQGHEGAPDGWRALDPALLDGLEGIRPGDSLIVVTWLDRASRVCT